MARQPQCPFCLREFDTVEEVTRHLIFDNCQISPTIRTPQDIPEPDGGPVSENHNAIVPQS